MDEKAAPKRATGRREPLLALGLLFGGTGVLAVVALAWAPIAGWLQALLALMLLTIPTFVLRGSGTTIDDLGVDLGPLGRTLGTSAVVMLILTPLYVSGFHLVHAELLSRPAHWSLSSLQRWDDDVRDTPPSPCHRSTDTALAWTTGEALWILPPKAMALTVTMDTAPQVRPKVARCGDDGRVRAQQPVVRSGDASWALPEGHGMRVELGDAQRIGAEVRLNGTLASLEVGAFRQGRDDDGRLDISRGPWWLLTFLVVHLGLVALPEEWFFRGYLQTRLDQRFGTPWRLLGVSVGPALIWSALAFALLHPILIPGGHRLLVFFPALLFGWLRARTGNIGAAVVVHAGCNLLQAVTSGMYG